MYPDVRQTIRSIRSMHDSFTHLISCAKCTFVCNDVDIDDILIMGETYRAYQIILLIFLVHISSSGQKLELGRCQQSTEVVFFRMIAEG